MKHESVKLQRLRRVNLAIFLKALTLVVFSGEVCVVSEVLKNYVITIVRIDIIIHL